MPRLQRQDDVSLHKRRRHDKTVSRSSDSVVSRVETVLTGTEGSIHDSSLSKGRRTDTRSSSIGGGISKDVQTNLAVPQGMR